MTTVVEKSVGVEIFEKATKCCYSCQKQKEKMFASHDNRLFICKECACVLNTANEEFKIHGEVSGSIKLVKRSIQDPFDFCDWHNDKISLIGKLIFSFGSNESPKCCSECIQKAANL